MQVLGSDVGFAAAHKHCWGPVTGEQRLRVAVQCGAENRGEQESVSPGSREVAIVTPKPASPPSSISDAPPNAQVPRLEAGASAPGSHFQPLTEPISPPILSAPHSQLLGSGPPVLVQTLPPPPPQGHLASSRPVPRPFDPPLSKTQT